MLRELLLLGVSTFNLLTPTIKRNEQIQIENFQEINVDKFKDYKVNEINSTRAYFYFAIKNVSYLNEIDGNVENYDVIIGGAQMTGLQVNNLNTTQYYDEETDTIYLSQESYIESYLTFPEWVTCSKNRQSDLYVKFDWIRINLTFHREQLKLNWNFIYDVYNYNVYQFDLKYNNEHPNRTEYEQFNGKGIKAYNWETLNPYNIPLNTGANRQGMILHLSDTITNFTSWPLYQTMTYQGILFALDNVLFDALEINYKAPRDIYYSQDGTANSNNNNTFHLHNDETNSDIYFIFDSIRVRPYNSTDFIKWIEPEMIYPNVDNDGYYTPFLNLCVREWQTIKFIKANQNYLCAVTKSYTSTNELKITNGTNFSNILDSGSNSYTYIYSGETNGAFDLLGTAFHQIASILGMSIIGNITLGTFIFIPIIVTMILFVLRLLQK